ncbi:MAG: glutaminyl-peptide cyclotransferase [Pseudonocardiaceae bacterium]
MLTALMLAALLSSCDAPQPSAQQLGVQVLATLPHDESMYTQGLEIAGGVLYEGSGQVGQSRVRTMTLPGVGLPGAALPDPGLPEDPGLAGTDGSWTEGAVTTMLRETALPAPLFGEGLTVAGDRLWQLTWTSGIAIERDPATLAERRRVTYQGEGWGLCDEGDRLVMSDGSDRLTFRDPVTFAPTGQVAVRFDGAPVRRLNELECVNGAVWANVYQTDRIVRIDPTTGAVTGVVDAAGLLTAEQRTAADVLNGIAAIPNTDEFLITGKHWPTLFRVRFVPS